MKSGVVDVCSACGMTVELQFLLFWSWWRHSNSCLWHCSSSHSQLSPPLHRLPVTASAPRAPYHNILIQCRTTDGSVGEVVATVYVRLAARRQSDFGSESTTIAQQQQQQASLIYLPGDFRGSRVGCNSSCQSPPLSLSYIYIKYPRSGHSFCSSANRVKFERNASTPREVTAKRNHNVETCSPV